MRRCGRCKHALNAMDGETPFVVCTLIPPTHVLGVDEAGKPKLSWVRPHMSVKGWCGQFRVSLRQWLGYGPRA